MKSVLDHLFEHAERDPDAGCVRLVRARGEGRAASVGEVRDGALRAAAGLHARGVRAGDIVAIIGTHDVDLYAAWLGAVWLGAVPAVLAVPAVRVDRDSYRGRLERLFSLSKISLAVVEPEHLERVGAVPGATMVTPGALAATGEPPPPRHPHGPDDPLLLQHSSGTTGLQKGVMLTHRMVMGCAEAVLARRRSRAGDICVSWLPLYHDMGLIGTFVFGMVAGMTMVWLSPFEWVMSPALLLEAVGENRATHTWMPNFAFHFLADRVAEPPEAFDLRSLVAVYSGGEPVTYAALRAFAERYAPAGVRWDMLNGAYGMAETVLTISASGPALRPRVATLDRTAWRDGHRAVEVAPGTPGALVQVSSGTPLEGCEVKILGRGGEPLAPGHAGRIWVRCPYQFNGYHRRPELDVGRFDGSGFFDTQDVGWRDLDGHLFVTGREKELIILAGRNVYPADVEAAVSRVHGLAPGRVVCFGVPREDAGTEGAVVLAESDEPEARWPELEEAILESASRFAEVELLDARIVPRRSLEKSTSGKLAREANAARYLAGGPWPGAGR